MAYNRSSFPEDYDIFEEKFDLPPRKEPLAQEWTELHNKGEDRSPSEDTRYAELTEELTPYLINPEDINYFQDAMTNVQKFFKENTQDYVDRLQKETKDYTDKKQEEMNKFVEVRKDDLEDKQSETLKFVDNKQVEMNKFVESNKKDLEDKQTETLDTISQFHYRGVYKKDTQYREWNTVTFRGNVYLAKEDVIGKDPSNQKYWLMIAENGDKVNWRGTWSQVIYYEQLDMVIYNNSVYICQINNYDKVPNLETDYWNIVIDNRQEVKTSFYKKFKDGGFKIQHNMNGYPDVKTIFTNTYGHGGFGMFGIRNEFEVENVVEYIDSNIIKIFMVEEFKGIPSVEKQKEGVYFVQYENEDFPLKVYLK